MDNKNEQFSLIYDQYIDKIYRFVYLKVNSQEIAEDITSKVFLKGWESYQNNQNIKNIGAFLYQIARNNVVDHYREKGRAQIVSADFAHQIVDNKTNLHEEAVFNADVQMVKLAIKNLKQDYQDVLILHYLEDMSTEEVSVILNKPAGTVRVMIHRGLEMLKEELIEEA